VDETDEAAANPAADWVGVSFPFFRSSWASCACAALCFAFALLNLSELPPGMIQESDMIQTVKEEPGWGLGLCTMVSRF